MSKLEKIMPVAFIFMLVSVILCWMFVDYDTGLYIMFYGILISTVVTVATLVLEGR